MSSHKHRHKSTHKDKEHKDKHSEKKSKKDSKVAMTIFIFRGQPDVYYKRHVLIYFESPEDPNFHETLHVQREDASLPWAIDHSDTAREWGLSKRYINHVYVPIVAVAEGRQKDVVNAAKSVSVEGKEVDSSWNCQNFVYEALGAIAGVGYLTSEQCTEVEEELMDKLIEGAVG
ncbi:hypothetical protein G7054_g15234 [Neopestalotiopsis clavispora]|nr:hypothetical protein G7054_g15234 [Neopestalotiopsis clavispora]